MKAQYQKYLDALKGKDFSTPAGQYTSALSSANSKLSSAESTINSSEWIEKGLEIIKGSVIPSFKSQITQLEGGLGALSQVGGKVNELVSACEALKSLEEQLTALGEPWSYVEGGKKSRSEVESHNNQITETKQKITEQEGTIDGIVASINGISFSFSSVQTTFSGHIDDIKRVVEEDKKVNETTLTSDGKRKYSIPSDPTIAAKKAQFLGDCDDPNNYTTYTGKNLYSRRNELELFDNTTGEIIRGDGGKIKIKKGETRVITVKLPSDTGEITKITRTTADGNAGYRAGNVVKARSDIDPDPNNVEYVRIVEGGNHMPSDASLLKNNSYDWIITGVGDGKVTCSQTCLWSSTMTGNRNLKAMIDLEVEVVD